MTTETRFRVPTRDVGRVRAIAREHACTSPIDAGRLWQLRADFDLMAGTFADWDRDAWGHARFVWALPDGRHSNTRSKALAIWAEAVA